MSAHTDILASTDDREHTKTTVLRHEKIRILHPRGLKTSTKSFSSTEKENFASIA